MKIAFIGQKGMPAVTGGVEKHVEELSIHLANLGHNVTVYNRPRYTQKMLKEYRGVNLINLPSIPTKHLDAISHTFFACLHAIFFRNFDIIHFHSIGPSSLIWLFKIFKPKTPVIATFHIQCYHHKKWGKFARGCLRGGEYVLCRLADKVITVSKILKIYVWKKYDREAVYIPNGVKQQSSVPAQIIKARWGLEKNSYIVVVSRLIAHKGIHHVIDAYNRLATDKKLVIVGNGYFTDEYTSRLEEMAAGNKNIIFTGNQTSLTLAELFSNAYFFIQPSEAEGMSIALLEAMSFSKAVLVSDIPANLEVVNGYGFIFKNKDASDLKKMMKYLLAHPQLVASRGKFARDYVNKKFNWERISEEIVDVYFEALREKRPLELLESAGINRNL